MGEPDGPMNIVVMDKSCGGAAKPAECKQPPTPRVLAALAGGFGARRLASAASKRSSIHAPTFGFNVQNPLGLSSQIRPISSPRSLRTESRLSRRQSVSQWQSH